MNEEELHEREEKVEEEMSKINFILLNEITSGRLLEKDPKSYLEHVGEFPYGNFALSPMTIRRMDDPFLNIIVIYSGPDGLEVGDCVEIKFNSNLKIASWLTEISNKIDCLQAALYLRMFLERVVLNVRNDKDFFKEVKE